MEMVELQDKNYHGYPGAAAGIWEDVMKFRNQIVMVLPVVLVLIWMGTPRTASSSALSPASHSQSFTGESNTLSLLSLDRENIRRSWNETDRNSAGELYTMVLASTLGMYFNMELAEAVDLGSVLSVFDSSGVLLSETAPSFSILLGQLGPRPKHAPSPAGGLSFPYKPIMAPLEYSE